MEHATIRVGLDMDGVLADWNAAWQKHIKKHTGKVLTLPSDGPQTWNWDKDGGLDPVELKMLWEAAEGDKLFWESLRPLPTATYALDHLDIFARKGALELYFITSRRGVLAKRQTERWLERWGITYPTVLLATDAQHKGQLAHALVLDYVVEDSGKNLKAMRELAGVRAYIIDAPYNRDFTDAVRVPTVGKFADAIVAEVLK